MNLPYTWTKKDITIAALTFLFVLSCGSLSRIDETPCEPYLGSHGGLFFVGGFLMSLPVDIPLVTMMHLINSLFGNQATGYNPLSYDVFFNILPYITAVVYALVVLIFLAKPKEIKKV